VLLGCNAVLVGIWFFVDVLILGYETAVYLKTAGTKYPVMQHNIPGQLISHSRCCKNQKSFKLNICFM
jgi:hypothetical protein